MVFRRIFLAAIFIASQTFAADAPKIRLVPFLSDLDNPVAMADDGSGRIFVVEQKGVIRLAQDGQLAKEPYLDIRDRVKFGGERGFLCVVFHPQFAKNGRFFVNYTSEVSGHLETIVSEFNAPPRAQTANANTERVILRFDQPYDNHNGGQLAFGTDGMLYIGNGDGGSGGDPHNHGQQLDTWLAKILRIDINKAPYAVPPDNPFVGKAGAMPEIWAYGMRNPWRFSFDRQTHQIYCGDVGQDKWEEVDIIEKGKNYGWSAREGMHDYNPKRANGALIDPIKDYPHANGDNCVTGGYVYRGKLYPELQGIYFYADFGSGRIWGLRWDGHALALDAEMLHPHMNISSFGEDRDGELYVLDYFGGKVYRLAQ